VTVADIEQIIVSGAGDLSTIPALTTSLDSVHLPDTAVQSLIKQVFDLVQSNPAISSWGKSCIQALFGQSLDPRTRVKDAFFFPNPESEKRLIKYLKRANKSMIVAVFTLTNDDLAREIRNARSRGVQIRIISDDDLMSMQGSDIRTMYEEGIEVRVDLNPRAQMHHKFCVIDDYLLITGSFNWTKQAVNKNQENLVVIQRNLIKCGRISNHALKSTSAEDVLEKLRKTCLCKRFRVALKLKRLRMALSLSK
jgi:phosphatidylserine/phosphatidylglycerophosphate/cardiolipin synthase-like enzyme